MGPRSSTACSQTSAWISSAAACQPSALGRSPRMRARRAPRSAASQHKTFEAVKCLAARRTSQIPRSGSRQCASASSTWRCSRIHARASIAVPVGDVKVHGVEQRTPDVVLALMPVVGSPHQRRICLLTCPGRLKLAPRQGAERAVALPHRCAGAGVLSLESDPQVGGQSDPGTAPRLGRGLPRRRWDRPSAAGTSTPRSRSAPRARSLRSQRGSRTPQWVRRHCPQVRAPQGKALSGARRAPSANVDRGLHCSQSKLGLEVASHSLG